MAQVTMELRDVLNLDGFELFDFDYPATDPTWKANLEEIIIDKYYFEEIGQESIDRFKHVFRSTMQRIMGYYDELYQTTLLGGDPLTNYKMTETFDEQNTGTQGYTTNIDETTDQDVKSSDYPQTGNPDLDILSGQQVSRESNNANNTQNRTDDLKRQYEKVIEGYTGISYPELVQQHRKNILRINSMIIDELKHCFILVY